jgi:RsiW-degrading membrane proteinase PrsW (M82 family)
LIWFFLLVLLSLIPGLFWMWWYYRQDKYNKEPFRLLAVVFLVSIPLSLLVGLFEYGIDQAYRDSGKPISQSDNFPALIIFYLLVVSVSEEVSKFAATYLIAYHNRAFDEEMDGIIYAAAAGLGFATFENLFFIFDQGPVVLLLRGPLSTLGHVLFSAMWGASLGLSKFDQARGRAIRRVLLGLGLAIISHAIYDLLITLGIRVSEIFALIVSILFLAAMYYLVARQISYALHISQFNPAGAVKTIRQLRRNTYRGEPPRYVPNPYLNNSALRGNPKPQQPSREQEADQPGESEEGN